MLQREIEGAEKDVEENPGCDDIFSRTAFRSYCCKSLVLCIVFHPAGHDPSELKPPHPSPSPLWVPFGPSKSMPAVNLPASAFPLFVYSVCLSLFLSLIPSAGTSCPTLVISLFPFSMPAFETSSPRFVTSVFFAVLPSSLQPLLLQFCCSSPSNINVLPSGLVSMSNSSAPVARAIFSANSMSLV